MRRYALVDGGLVVTAEEREGGLVSATTDSAVTAAGVPGRFADAVDVARYREYRIGRDPADLRPLYRFAGRIRTGPDAQLPAKPGRYHLYSGWFCPWVHLNPFQRSGWGHELADAAAPA